METETAKAIAERSNTGLVASVWRSGKNFGIRFIKSPKPDGSKVEELTRKTPRGED